MFQVLSETLSGHGNRPLVEQGAAWLRAQLGLRLFGFDIVVQQCSGGFFSTGAHCGPATVTPLNSMHLQCMNPELYCA